MSLANVKVFQDFAYGSMTETTDQQFDKFNEASNGALNLSTHMNVGDIKQGASFKAISGLIRRRDAYGSAALTSVPLQQLQHNTVKVAGGTVPVTYEPQQFQYIQQNPKLAGLKMGEQLAVGMVRDQLNTAISCAAAAITGNTALVKDLGAAGAATFNSLNQASSLYGDQAQNIVAWVMHSKVMFDLYSNALTAGAYLFNYGNVSVIRDPFGRLFVVTDSPALALTGANLGKYMSLGLIADAVTVETNNDFNDTMLTVPGSENIKTTYQAEWTYNVGLAGYSWTAATGGASPTDTALATPANWTKTSSFNKTTAGIALISG